MAGQDFEILEELFDLLEQLEQRLGEVPKRSYPSSSRKLRKDVADYAGKCQRGELNGKARKRKSGQLFRKLVALHPDVWSK